MPGLLIVPRASHEQTTYVFASHGAAAQFVVIVVLIVLVLAWAAVQPKECDG